MRQILLERTKWQELMKEPELVAYLLEQDFVRSHFQHGLALVLDYCDQFRFALGLDDAFVFEIGFVGFEVFVHLLNVGGLGVGELVAEALQEGGGVVLDVVEAEAGRIDGLWAAPDQDIEQLLGETCQRLLALVQLIVLEDSELADDLVLEGEAGARFRLVAFHQAEAAHVLGGDGVACFHVGIGGGDVVPTYHVVQGPRQASLEVIQRI